MNTSRSMWSPLSEPVYRALWIAAVVSNVGSFMQEVGSAWLMTSIAPNPLMVALLQTAAYLPFFLLAIPSGAFADVVDKRKLLIIGQLWMLLSSLALGVPFNLRIGYSLGASGANIHDGDWRLHYRTGVECSHT